MSEQFDPDAFLAEPAFDPDAFLRDEDPFAGAVAAAEGIMPRAPKDPGFLRAVGSELLSGYFKGGSDEAMGAVTGAAVDPGVGWKQPDGSVRYLKTEGDVYRAGRDTERAVLAGAEAHRPKTSFLSRMAGDVASDATLALLGGGLKPTNPLGPYGCF